MEPDRIRRAGVAGAAALTLAAAGCGGGGDSGLDRRALVAKANAICAKYAKQGAKLKAPGDISDPRQAKAFFDKVHAIAQRQQDELEGLDPAKEVQARYAAVTRATGDATTLLRDLAAAAAAKDAGKGAELLQRLQPDSDKVDRAANAIGARNCAS